MSRPPDSAALRLRSIPLPPGLHSDHPPAFRKAHKPAPREVAALQASVRALPPSPEDDPSVAPEASVAGNGAWQSAMQRSGIRGVRRRISPCPHPRWMCPRVQGERNGMPLGISASRLEPAFNDWPSFAPADLLRTASSKGSPSGTEGEATPSAVKMARKGVLGNAIHPDRAKVSLVARRVLSMSNRGLASWLMEALARTWADNPADRPLVSSSVPDSPKDAAAAPAARVVSPTVPVEVLSREQIQEAADQLLRELGSALQSLVFTMINWDLPNPPAPPPPETFVPLSVQPPPSLTDDPGNGPPPPPADSLSNQSPEPGTLIARPRRSRGDRLPLPSPSADQAARRTLRRKK